MTIYYVDSTKSVVYQTTTAYSQGQMVRPSVGSANQWNVLEVTTAGTSGAAEGAWPTSAGATVNGTATFTSRTGADGWNKAMGRLSGIMTRSAGGTSTSRGDIILVSKDHQEDNTGVLSFASSNSNGSVTVISVDPATNLYSPAVNPLAVPNATAINISSTNVEYHGFTFQSGDGGAGTNTIVFANGSARLTMRFYNCTFYLNTTGASASINVGSGAGLNTIVEFYNCVFRFGATGQTIKIYDGTVRMFGCSIHPSSAAITTLFTPQSSSSSLVECYGCDFSAGAASLNLRATSTADISVLWTFDNCKLPASWTYATTAAPLNWKMIMRGCGSPYQHTQLSSSGRIDEVTTHYRYAVSGSTGYSWKMVLTAAQAADELKMRSEWVYVNVSTAGDKTVTINTLYDGSAGLTDAEMWLEVEYMDGSGDRTTTFANDYQPVGVTQTLGTASEWTKPAAGTGWIAQKCEASITTGVSGYIRARVVLAKVATIYDDPQISIL